MEEYWEHNDPTAIAAAEHQDEAMNAWQMGREPLLERLLNEV